MNDSRYPFIIIHVRLVVSGTKEVDKAPSGDNGLRSMAISVPSPRYAFSFSRTISLCLTIFCVEVTFQMPLPIQRENVIKHVHCPRHPSFVRSSNSSSLVLTCRDMAWTWISSTNLSHFKIAHFLRAERNIVGLVCCSESLFVFDDRLRLKCHGNDADICYM